MSPISFLQQFFTLPQTDVCEGPWYHVVDRQGAKRGEEEELAGSLGAGMVWHGGTSFENNWPLHAGWGSSEAERIHSLRYTKSARLNFFSQTAIRLC